MCLALFTCTMLFLKAVPTGRSLAGCLSILVAATAEELVFRVVLWQRIRGWLRRAQYSSQGARSLSGLVSSMTFSFAHFAGRGVDFQMPDQASDTLLRLFALGLLYQGLARAGGVGIAIMIHTTVNVAVIRSTFVGGSSLAMAVVFGTIIIATMGPWCRRVPAQGVLQLKAER